MNELELSPEDIELTRRAALANGAEEYYPRTQSAKYGEYLRAFNPLQNDADAFRLAVSARVMLLWFKDRVTATAWHESKGRGINESFSVHGDHEAAARRAIVRAVAALED